MKLEEFVTTSAKIVEQKTMGYATIVVGLFQIFVVFV